MQPRGLRYLDLGITGAILVLVLLLFRRADVGSGWRASLLAVTCLSFMHAALARRLPWAGLPPVGRRLLLLWGALVLLMAIASVVGATFSIAASEFWQGFIMPAMLPLVLIGHFTTASRWKALLAAVIGAILLSMARNAIQYFGEWFALGRLSPDIHLHRHFGEALVLGLPFLLLAVHLAGSRLQVVAWAIPVVALLMIAGTGARGAWLGALAAIGVHVLLLRSKRLTLTVSVIGLAAAIIAAAVVPSELLTARLRQGVDTSLRTSGTWGPAVEMIADHPVMGYGFGDDVFHAEFNRRAPSSPNWSFQTSMGPHNFFLAAGFAAGFPGLALLLILLGYAIWLLVPRANLLLRQAGEGHRIGLSGVALLGAVTGVFLVMGLVENINWRLFAFWLALLLVWLQVGCEHMHEKKEMG